MAVLYKATHHRASCHGCHGRAPSLVRAAYRPRASPLSYATPRTWAARSATAGYNRFVSARGPALGWERRTNASSRAAPDATSDQRQSVEDHGADVSTAGRRMPRSSSGHETRRLNPYGVARRVVSRRRSSTCRGVSTGPRRGFDARTDPNAARTRGRASMRASLLKRRVVLREIDQKCLKRRRVRHRRLHVYSTDPKRPQGHLFDGD